jgi:hypothetical protein
MQATLDLVPVTTLSRAKSHIAQSLPENNFRETKAPRPETQNHKQKISFFMLYTGKQGYAPLCSHLLTAPDYSGVVEHPISGTTIQM